MANETTERKRPKLKLSGMDGNVFSIAGRARTAALKAKWTEAEWDAVWAEAKGTHSYDGVLQTLMRHFDCR